MKYTGFIVFLVVAVLGVVAIAWSNGYFSGTSENKPTETITENNSGNYEKHIQESGYKIDIFIKASGNKKYDEYIQREVKKYAEDFDAYAKKLLATISTSEGEQERSPALWTASWEGEKVSEIGGYMNYVVNSYEFTGGAHGNPNVWSYVFDSKSTTAQPLRLSELFRTDFDDTAGPNGRLNVRNNWLMRVSEAARKELLAGHIYNSEPGVVTQAEPDMFSLESIGTGVDPDESNFSRFIVTSDGLVILFTAYQVGPYVIGEPEVLIPWSELSGVVRPEVLERLGTPTTVN